MDPQDLRQKIAYVPQQPDVFYGTIAQNLRLSEPLASDDDLRWAAEQTGLLDLIETFPDGFDTRIGMGHTEDLPPGTLQRLNLTRALVAQIPHYPFGRASAVSGPGWRPNFNGFDPKSSWQANRGDGVSSA